MKRSVTRRNVSTLRATVPCASVACSSSSRFSEVAADLELINSVLEPLGGDDFFVAGKRNWKHRSGAGDAIGVRMPLKCRECAPWDPPAKIGGKAFRFGIFRGESAPERSRLVTWRQGVMDGFRCTMI